MQTMSISDQEFTQFQKLIHEIAGIHMSPSKKSLVTGRLAKRLNHHSLTRYGDYFHLLRCGSHPEELQTAVDLLTTNETYFFREPKHFEFLQQKIMPSHAAGKPFRVWSAACSSGQEPYSIAMTLANMLGDRPWEILASDISTRVLKKAKSGHYPLEQTRHIPKSYLSKYCLKGVGDQEGTFIVERNIRSRIKFSHINLNTTLPAMDVMDLIFLRNVMIYFNGDTKQEVVRRLTATLKPGGYLFVGHSESLNGICDNLKNIAPAIYQKI